MQRGMCVSRGQHHPVQAANVRLHVTQWSKTYKYQIHISFSQSSVLSPPTSLLAVRGKASSYPNRSSFSFKWGAPAQSPTYTLTSAFSTLLPVCLSDYEENTAAPSVTTQWLLYVVVFLVIIVCVCVWEQGQGDVLREGMMTLGGQAVL